VAADPPTQRSLTHPSAASPRWNSAGADTG
jgi:hypothetical protein